MSEVMDETVVAGRAQLFAVISISRVKKIGYDIGSFINH